MATTSMGKRNLTRTSRRQVPDQDKDKSKYEEVIFDECTKDFQLSFYHMATSRLAGVRLEINALRHPSFFSGRFCIADDGSLPFSREGEASNCVLEKGNKSTISNGYQRVSTLVIPMSALNGVV